MAMTNMYGNSLPPSNNSMWIGNNYAAGTPKNNYVPTNQNSMYAPNQMIQPQSINNVYQVMGPESAQSFQTGPDSNVILMDSNRPVFYWKKSDSTGYSKTRAFEFQEIPLFDQAQIPVQEAQVTNQEYVTKSDFEDFKKMIEDLVMKNE